MISSKEMEKVLESKDFAAAVKRADDEFYVPSTSEEPTDFSEECTKLKHTPEPVDDVSEFLNGIKETFETEYEARKQKKSKKKPEEKKEVDDVGDILSAIEEAFTEERPRKKKIKLKVKMPDDGASENLKNPKDTKPKKSKKMPTDDISDFLSGLKETFGTVFESRKRKAEVQESKKTKKQKKPDEEPVDDVGDILTAIEEAFTKETEKPAKKPKKKQEEKKLPEDIDECGPGRIAQGIDECGTGRVAKTYGEIPFHNTLSFLVCMHCHQSMLQNLTVLPLGNSARNYNFTLCMR